MSDRVAVLGDGALLALGTPGELARRMAPRLEVSLELDPAQLATATSVIGMLDGLTVSPERAGMLRVAGIARERIPELAARLVGAGVSPVPTGAARAVAHGRVLRVAARGQWHREWAMNTRIIRAIVRKDLRVVRRSRALMTPLIVLPVLLMIVFPTVFTFLPRMMGGAREAFAEMFRNLPDPVKRQFGEFTEATWIHVVHTQLLAPLMLLVPFMVANVIAADGFAGERERKTLEPLLYTPATDAELFVAKLLAAWIPAVMIAFCGALVYAVIVNIVAWPVMQRVVLPEPDVDVMVLWMAPVFAALGLGGMLLVSLRVRGMQEATQLGGLFVLPVIALVVGEVRGAILLGPLDGGGDRARGLGDRRRVAPLRSQAVQAHVAGRQIVITPLPSAPRWPMTPA